MRNKLNPLIILVSLLSYCATAAKAEEFSWGIPQEGVKIGVVQRPWSTHNGVITICIARTTNYMNDLVLPSDFQQSFECTLKGPNTLPVEKTAAGKRYGAKLQTNMPRSKRISGELKDNFGNDLMQLAFFEIDKTFIITDSGRYELEIRARLLKESTNGLVPVAFYPIKVNLDLVANKRELVTHP